MHKDIKYTKEIWRYMEALVLHTGAPKVHWEYNTSCSYIVEAKRFIPTVKHIAIPAYFLQYFLTMLFLFQNIRIIVSYQQICASNHVQVQLSDGVLNGGLVSDSIQPVIQNTINS